MITGIGLPPSLAIRKASSAVGAAIPQTPSHSTANSADERRRKIGLTTKYIGITCFLLEFIWRLQHIPERVVNSVTSGNSCYRDTEMWGISVAAIVSHRDQRP